MKKIINKNKKPIWGKITALAACAALIAALSQTAFAKELWFKIVSKVSTGRNEFYTMEESKEDFPALFYDADGNPVPNDADYDPAVTYYDANGEVITDVQAYLEEKVKELFPNDYEHIDIGLSDKTVTDTLTMLEEHDYIVVRGEDAADKAAENLIFTPLLPTRLPEGYSLAGAAYFSDSGKYLTVVYANAEDEELVVHERFMDEETAFAAGTDGTVEETEVNGHTAALTNGISLDWEDGDVAIGITSNDSINRSQLMDMAESFK